MMISGFEVIANGIDIDRDVLFHFWKETPYGSEYANHGLLVARYSLLVAG